MHRRGLDLQAEQVKHNFNIIVIKVLLVDFFAGISCPMYRTISIDFEKDNKIYILMQKKSLMQFTSNAVKSGLNVILIKVLVYLINIVHYLFTFIPNLHLI